MQTRLSSEQVEQACAYYRDGASTPKIGEMFGVTSAAIRAWLVKKGVERRSAHKAGLKYSCDWRYFEVIDEPDKAYFLGFVAADGCVLPDDNCLAISLGSKDRDHLLRFRKSINGNHPIGDYEHESRFGDYSFQAKNSCIRITSPEMVSDLQNKGVGARKTFTFEWVRGVPDNLVGCFVLGYFDGDGGVYRYYCKKRNYYKEQFQVTGNEPFILKLRSVLMDRCSVSRGTISQRNKETPIYTLQYTGRLQLSRIHEFLYGSRSACLPRKKEVFDLCIKGGRA